MGPLTELFKMIYRDQVIPDQWLMSKIILAHKKGDKKQYFEEEKIKGLLVGVDAK